VQHGSACRFCGLHHTFDQSASQGITQEKGGKRSAHTGQEIDHEDTAVQDEKAISQGVWPGTGSDAQNSV
jgi:hypothetical protein